MEHTPGPWKLSGGFTMDELHFIYVMAGETHIARVDNESKEICEANAQLIASAPKLYKALKDLATCFRNIEILSNVTDEFEKHSLGIAVDEMTKAIAEVEGAGRG